MYSRPVAQLIKALSRLPSVGERTAERYAFYLLKSGKKEVQSLINSLTDFMSTMRSCEICQDFADQSPCLICSRKDRQNGIICVVSEPQDVQAIEESGSYRGRYHVLRGTISPDEDDTKSLKISELLKRLHESGLSEIILALNHDMAGETTALYLEKKIKAERPSIIVSRLARGLPMGSDLKYADAVTLGSALQNRVRG
jgi:recombination protein RecR